MEPSIPGRIDRYEVISKLGEGGMAVVFKALDPRLKREVAIKLIRTDLFGPAILSQLRVRFEREAQALARLHHPNIVSVFDYGEHLGGPYIVMNYLSGGTLAQRLGKAMPPSAALNLLLPIANGLAHAHARGILHRDMKPVNILFDADEQPQISDFGIARLLDSQEGGTLTGTGTALGTPAYMAPEQWHNLVSPQSDEYSLAVILYEMLSGRRPYAADTPAGFFEEQISHPAPPINTYAPETPKALAEALARALARRPGERFASIREFANALESSLTAAPPPALPPVEPAPQPADSRAVPVVPPDDGPTLPTPTPSPVPAIATGIRSLNPPPPTGLKMPAPTVDEPPQATIPQPLIPVRRKVSYVPWALAAGAAILIIILLVGTNLFNRSQALTNTATFQAAALAFPSPSATTEEKPAIVPEATVTSTARPSATVTATPAPTNTSGPTATKTSTRTAQPASTQVALADMVTGYITWNCQPVEGISFVLTDWPANKVIQSTTTNDRGYYRLVDVSPGTYYFYINGAEGFGQKNPVYGDFFNGFSKEAGNKFEINYPLQKIDLVITDPLPGKTVSSLTPTFTWNAYPDVYTYDIRLYKDGMEVLQVEYPKTSYQIRTALAAKSEYQLFVAAISFCDGNWLGRTADRITFYTP